MAESLKAIALVCSLNPSPAKSSSELMARHVLSELSKWNVTGEVVRIADRNVRSGVAIDMGNDDEWPQIRQQILDSDILILSTPIWVGHPASNAQKVIERLDAELSETDEKGRLLTSGKVAVVAVVGNEDGAHKVIADTLQALNDVGFSIPSGGSTYWVGEAMHKTDYKDLDEVPEIVATTTKTLATNTAHLARLLKADAYPPVTDT